MLYVPSCLMCLMCPRALRALVLYVPSCPRALRVLVPYVPSRLAYPHACVPLCALRALRVLHAIVPYVY